MVGGVEANFYAPSILDRIESANLAKNCRQVVEVELLAFHNCSLENV